MALEYCARPRQALKRLPFRGQAIEPGAGRDDLDREVRGTDREGHAIRLPGGERCGGRDFAYELHFGLRRQMRSDIAAKSERSGAGSA
jgi:hypothetical protein